MILLRIQKRFFPAPPPNLNNPHLFKAIHTQSNNGVLDFFDQLLQHCINTIDESFDLKRPVKQIHTQIVLTSSFSPFLSARLISAYAKLSLVNDARKVFDNCPKDCFFSSLFWNSMLRAYVSGFSYEDALGLYSRMRELNYVQPDGFGFPLILKACAMSGGVRLGGIVHCHAIQIGLSNNLHVSNELVGMYGEFGWREVALKVFDQMPLRSRVSWNVMVSNFAKSYDCDGAYGMLCRMGNEGWDANSVTWTSLISSFTRCGHFDKTWELYVLMREKGVNGTAESIAVVISACAGMPIKGEIVHGYVITGGFEKYIFVINALISMYGRNGAVEKAENMFLELETKSLVSWNALISAYAQAGLCDEAFSAFQTLKNSIVKPNVVTWTALINAFAASEQRKDTTLELFRCMQFDQVRANVVTVATVLSVCADLSALCFGREIHAYTIRFLMDKEMLVTNGLINMYMKCGGLKKGHSLFEGMDCQDIISWNVMITGYGMHGLGDEALKIFYQMVGNGVKPDEVTFVAVLSACSHSGLVVEGRELFDRMIREFGIEARVEHYSCMVDLFGRAGLVEEASQVLKNMPMEPNVPVWGALLNSCKDTDSAEESAARVFELSSEAMGSYMLLSNLYAASGRWDESAKVRASARTRGLRKIAGQSWIEVKKKVHSFSAGKACNLDVEDLHGVLEDLKMQMVMDSSVSQGLFEIS